MRSGETLNQDVTLESGGTVTGKVMAVTPQGTVPLVGAQVAVVSMMSMFTGYPTAVSGEDGSYKIDGVKGGSQFQVTAVATGYVSPNFMDPDGRDHDARVGRRRHEGPDAVGRGRRRGRGHQQQGRPDLGRRARARAPRRRAGAAGSAAR